MTASVLRKLKALFHLPLSLFLSGLSSLLDHYASVAMVFKDQGGETVLSVDLKGVPSEFEDTTREGWNRFYFQAIKQTFGY